MRRVSLLFVSLLVALTAIDLYAAESGLNSIFRFYSNKPLQLEFRQISINSMSGQRIVKTGRLTIKPHEEMIFDYPDERIIINNFKVVDYKGGAKSVYKLTGFNKVLFLLFIGKEKIDDLFVVKRVGSGYVLRPKYKSNIDVVKLNFDKDNRLKGLTIVDIYSNRIIYKFSYDTSGKSALG